MSKTKFTEGEWVVVDNNNYFDIESTSGRIGDVCASQHRLDNYAHIKDGEAAANAYVMAQSTAMYNLLNEISICCTGVDTDEINNLLAKARGENL